MHTLTTERLILRPFTREDFSDVHSYACVPENTTYMVWGPNTAEQTRAFIAMALSHGAENPCTDYQFAAVLSETHGLIGACNLTLSGDEAEIGWILHRDYWKRGYGTEMGKALLRFGFDELGLHRILAHCDAENIGSYRVMEKIGMRREGVFLEGRPPHKQSNQKYGDDLSYAILKDEWETQKEIAYYNALPVVFDDFIRLPALSDGTIHLVCTAKNPAIPDKKYVPSYDFAICIGSEKIGEINLRIGYAGFGPDASSLYYGGQIGYGIDEKHRGQGYAVRACRLLRPVAQAHGMTTLLITNNITNTASRRVCEKLNARLVRVARLPAWHPLYEEGQRFSNIFEWDMA